MAAKMQLNINVDGNNITIGINGSGNPPRGWSAEWDCISGHIKKALIERDSESKKSRETALESLAGLIGKTVEETRQLCKATGKDMSIAMLEVALNFANKQDK